MPGRLEVDLEPGTLEKIRPALISRRAQDPLQDHSDSIRPSRLPKLDGRAEAHLVALACSKPPEGRNEWTMQLLADKPVELQIVDSTSDETVRRTLQKTN